MISILCKVSTQLNMASCTTSHTLVGAMDEFTYSEPLQFGEGSKLLMHDECSYNNLFLHPLCPLFF